ncbi:MAG TPA: PPOX class F420-dependent oxidoreductase [Candidatus Dormibacteraeota bacterium]
MDAKAARDFVRENHRAILVTRRRDKSPQLSPIVVAADQAGHLVVSTRETAVKVRNLRRDPTYDMVVFTDRFFGAWISVRGQARVISLPGALAGLEQYYRDVSGEHPGWEEYRAAMVAERRVLLELEIAEVGPAVMG